MRALPPPRLLANDGGSEGWRHRGGPPHDVGGWGEAAMRAGERGRWLRPRGWVLFLLIKLALQKFFL